jgi:D-psicose/D-tagatose/L-ribulose 3-epimerase
MKIGINLYLWLTKLKPSHFELLAKLKSQGFDGVEIPTGDYTAEELATIRQALANEGLACTVATLLPPATNPIAASATIRSAAFDKLQHDINIASELGAEALIGPMHSGHKLFYDRGPNQQEIDRCIDFLTIVGSEAKQANLLLGVEPLNRFECYFLNTAAQAKQLADAVNLDNVGILYDTHHANIEEYNVYDAICGLNNRLNHFHVSESHRGTPGTGTVDWKNSFRALKDMDYSGWLVIESFAKDVDGFPEAVNIWRDCFSSKDEVIAQGLALIQQNLGVKSIS